MKKFPILQLQKMGGKCPHRRVKKRRYSHKTFRLAKFLVKDILFVHYSYEFFRLRFSLTANIGIFFGVYFLTFYSHAMTLFMMSLRNQMMRRRRCRLMKIYLGWVNTIVYTASKQLNFLNFRTCKIEIIL